MESFKTIVGGKWWKVDFHLHSPGSYDYGCGSEAQKNITPEDYLLECMKKELDCIVVTDHNTFDWIPKLRTALEKLKNNQIEGFREITVFPGIELNVQGNIHLLGIFDPCIEEKTLYAIPYLVDYNEELDTTKKSLNEVIEIITEKNGIAIPAHVDGPSGLFYEGAKPTIIKNALDTGRLLALEVLGDEINNGLYKDSKLNLSYVVGSDSHTMDTIGNKYTWVKMGEPNIEALRLALFDTADGVIRYNKISGNPNKRHGKTYIKKLEVINGKYIGRKNTYVIEFSPWLNSLIGGRGSGKSAVLKFIRLVLDRGDELPQTLLEDYKEFVKVPSNRTDLGMLQKRSADKSGTIVELEICVDGVDHRLKWEDSLIQELNVESGEWEIASYVKERFPVRMFAQKQLFEMTSDTNLLFEYLDSQWQYDLWKSQMESLKDDYNALNRKLRSLNDKARQRERLMVQLADINKKISVFETEQTKAVLLRKEELRQEEQKVKDLYKKCYPFIEWASGINEVVPIINDDDLNEMSPDTKQFMKDWHESIFSTFNRVSAIIKDSQNLMLSYDELLKKIPLSSEINKNQQDIENVINELRKAGVDDIDRYAELIREKEHLEKDISSFGNVSDEISECQKSIDVQIDRWKELAIYRYDSRKAVLEQWNSLGSLKMTLIPFADMNANEIAFRKIIRREGNVFNKEILEYDHEENLTKKGLLFFLSKEETLLSKMEELNEMKRKVLSSEPSLGKKFSSYLSGQFSSYPDSMDDLQMWLPADKLKLEINVNKTGKSQYRPIDAGSPGQRTSAILSLILGISNMPIIIDQPEDDLDTRNITDIVVESVNELKKRQQIIVVTHNPNIVVNTNSEQVVQLDYHNGQIVNACSGALQKHNVRDAICEVMEGGKEALEKRYYRIFKALEK